MFHNGDRGGICTRRGLKRSVSPDHSTIHERQSKTTKTQFRSDKDGGNKENYIKRCQSEMTLTKHSSSTWTNKDDLPWYHGHNLWTNMLTRTLNEQYQCREHFLDAHPAITTKMRSVLFDWLIEVCEVYHLHRETYHLTIAYIDQYLCHTNSFAKQKFQLLGITALFVAAKIEEIYPPQLTDFTYVTDNACSEDDILDMELDLMNALNWYINPVTSISWLLIYLQVQGEFEQLSMKTNPLKKRRISLSNLVKEFSSSSSIKEIVRSSILTDVHRSTPFLELFTTAVRLLDLCSLDIEYCHFSKHILAATAILCYQSDWPVQQLTGLTENDVDICRQWMKPFHEILSKTSASLTLKSSAAVPADEMYSIQIHNISIHLLDNVYENRPKFVPSTIKSRPLRDLLNHISWFPPLIEKSKYDDGQQQINELIISV